MPRGGERAGVPGEQYSNRADLQTQPRTAGQEKVYGDVAQQQAVQRTPDAAVPPPPGSLQSLTAPSDRPNEPLTTGLPIGPGAGPDALSPMPVRDDALYDLRAMLAQFPEYTGLARLIALAEERI